MAVTPADDDADDHASRDWLTATIARHEGTLILYAQRILAGDLARARDCVQETFLKLCRTPRGEVSGHEAAWLYTVCRRTALDVKRKERRMSLIADSTAVTADALPSTAPDPAALTEQSDSAAEVLRMLTHLPENQREAILLKFGHNLSYKEIAQVTGHTVSNVGFLIHTGIKTLRTRLTGAPV
jgi:RNA polymerase sigma-70 factor (ECF subfamily)